MSEILGQSTSAPREMKISRTVTKMESVEKDDAENSDFDEKDEEQYKAKNININEGREKDEVKKNKEKATKSNSAISDIMARFWRTFQLGPPSPSEASVCGLPSDHAITLHCIIQVNKELYN